MNNPIRHGPHLWSTREFEAAISEHRLADWVERAYFEFKTKVSDTAFPCTFGTIAERKGDVLYGYTDGGDEARLNDLRAALVEFTNALSTVSKVTASMMPFAFFMRPEALTPDEYFAKGWRMLQWLHEKDPAPWPDHVPTSPDNPAWSFCFNGMPLFINFKTPAHERRRSRQAARAYVWLIQAREGFDVVAGDTPQGRRAREIIREKLIAYDNLPIHSALAHYGTPANREWRQYFVPEPEQQLPTRCPFHSRHELEAAPVPSSESGTQVGDPSDKSVDAVDDKRN